MFSATTRDELARLVPEDRCCKIAELSALARMTGRLASEQRNSKHRETARTHRDAGSGPGFRGLHFEMATENAACARKIVTMMRELFDIRMVVEVAKRRGGGPGNLYVARLPCDGWASEALWEVGVLSRRGSRPGVKPGVPSRVVSRRCCRRAYLRGAFLARGYVQNPEKAYHMEFGADCEALARGIERLALSFGASARVSARRRGFVVYVKGGDDVVQLLRVVGAHGSVIALESVRVVRGMRGEVNRVVNCETANLTKAVDAGVAQVEAIRTLGRKMTLASLPPGLHDIARLRLAHPEATLKELGEMLVPPITKSAANHRVRRLICLARQAGAAAER